MRIIAFYLSIIYMGFMLSGCGAAQGISEGTTSVAKALFVWDVRTLHLDFSARAELNVDDNGRSSPVVIRIYQLSKSQTFESATYTDFVDNDVDALGDSLVESKEIILKPNTSISIDTPFDGKSEFVGIVALFKDPDLKSNNWRLVLKRRDLNINSAREIEVNQSALTLIKQD